MWWIIFLCFFIISKHLTRESFNRAKCLNKLYQWPQNQVKPGTIYKNQIRSPYLVLFYAWLPAAHLHAITGHLYAALFWILAVFLSSFFPWMILSIFIDYYILENNSLLKAALKYKRIQLTDFRTVPTEHFGENKALVSICRLNAVTAL